MRLPVHTILVLPLVALTLAAASPAHAGTYVVRACQGAGPANAAWSSTASPNLAAYEFCPIDNNRPWSSGMVNRTVVQSATATVPGYSVAAHRFDAPPGASLESMTFTAGFWVGNDPAQTGWLAGLWTIGADGAVTKRWGDCSYGQCTGAVYAVGGPAVVGLGGASTATFGLLCGRSECPASAHHAGSGDYQPRAWMNVGDVSVRVRDETPPAFGAVDGALWAGGWHRGTQAVRFDAGDNTGIATAAFDVDGTERASHPPACDFTRAKPCPDVHGDTFTLDTAGLADGDHSIRLRLGDAAQNPGATERTISVDNHAPAPPGALSLAGGEGWRHTPAFGLSWANPVGQVAPIARAHWAACRAPEHGGGCVQGSVSGDQIASLAGLTVPSPGDWTVRVRLEDAAGNADPAAVSDPVHVRYDPEGPDRLGFAARTADDPRRIEALIGDAVSGPAGGRIEIRRAGDEGEWIGLATQFTGDRLVARVDDEALTHGVYRGRVVAADHAGNQRTTDRYAEGEGDGGGFVIPIPARTPTRLAVVPQAGTAVYVPFAARRVLRGRLTTGTGTPVAAAALEVRAKGYSPLAVEQRVATVRTAQDGRFAYTAAAGSSREVRFYYHGSPVLGPARGNQRLLVRAAMTLRVSRRLVRNGRSVLFTGRLRGGPVPPQGKLVNLQAHYRRKWRTFATARSTSRGLFRTRYRFEVSYGRVVYRFRAMARREAAYPYELGISPSIKVTVIGPR